MPKFEFNEQEGFDLVMSNFNPEFLQAIIDRLEELGQLPELLKLSEGVYYHIKERGVILSPEQQKYLREAGNIKLDDCLIKAKEKQGAKV
jgi:hypothetical protein